MTRVAALRDVAEVERNPIKPEQITAGELFVGLENIESSGGFVAVEGVDAGEIASTKFRFSPEHILYGKLRPYLSKIARPSFSGICSTDILPVRPGPEIDRAYLYYFLRQPDMVRFATARCTGANLPRLSPKELEAFEIPLPPLEEQKRIAAILDKADAIRRKRQQAIELTDQLLRSVFLEMFGDPVTNPKGWMKASLRECAEIFSDGPFGSNLKSSHYQESGIRVIRLQNIGVNKLVDDDRAFVSPEHYKTIAKHTCLPGDIVVATLGDPNVRACILPSSINKAINKADCVQFRVSASSGNAEYFCALLNSSPFMTLVSHLLHGQTRTRVSMGTLREIEVPVPPLKLQDQFRTVVGKIHRLSTNCSEHEAEVVTMASSLGARAFAQT